MFTEFEASIRDGLLEQLESGSFGEEHVFYVDGFPDYTRQHMAILEHLIRVSPQITVGINCDVPGSQNPAFEKAGDTAAQLIRFARQMQIPVEIVTIPAEQTDMAMLCGSLFQGKLPEKLSGVQVLRTESAFAEVQAAAAQVLQLVQVQKQVLKLQIEQLMISKVMH